MPVQGKARKRPARPGRNVKLHKGNKVHDPVPVAPLRDFFLRGLERGDFTVCDIAHELEWYRGKTLRSRQGLDTTRVQRMLGVKGYSSSLHKNGKRYATGPRTLVNYDTAVLLCRALGADPCDMRDPETDEPIL